MDLLSLLRTLGGLAVVLGLLAGALWAVRRYDIKLPGRIGGGPVRRLELVERLAIDGKRTVALIRRDGCEHLVLLDPAGAVVIEGGVGHERVARGDDAAAEPAPEPEPVAKPVSFAAAVDALKAVGPAPGDDMVPFREALTRIQEKARRMRASAVAAAVSESDA